jgi:hypothetical protein
MIWNATVTEGIWSSLVNVSSACNADSIGFQLGVQRRGKSTWPKRKMPARKYNSKTIVSKTTIKQVR